MNHADRHTFLRVVEVIYIYRRIRSVLVVVRSSGLSHGVFDVTSACHAAVIVLGIFDVTSVCYAASLIVVVVVGARGVGRLALGVGRPLVTRPIVGGGIVVTGLYRSRLTSKMYRII